MIFIIKASPPGTWTEEISELRRLGEEEQLRSASWGTCRGRDEKW